MTDKTVVESDRLSEAVGQAAMRLWSDLPRDLQHRLFEEAVTVCGEASRSQLAALLHEKHRRTGHGERRGDAMEPDSLGG